MDEKAYFYQKFHLYFFRALFPMCNTFLESLGIAHWVQPVYVILIRVGPYSKFFRPRTSGFGQRMLGPVSDEPSF